MHLIADLLHVNFSFQDCHTEELNKLTIKAMVTFAPFELEYLKIVVKYIMESEAKEISQTHALHKIGEVASRKLTQTEAEKILQKFKDHEWLRFSPDKPNIRLSTRFIAEMEPFIKKNYKGLFYECKEVKCGKMVIQRVKCENCEASYHIYCVSRMQSANLRATGEDCARCVNCREMLSKILYSKFYRFMEKSMIFKQFKTCFRTQVYRGSSSSCKYSKTYL